MNNNFKSKIIIYYNYIIMCSMCSMFLIILVIIVIITLYTTYKYIFNNKLYETYDVYESNQNVMFGEKMHAQIDTKGNILSYSHKPPSAHGIYGCAIVPCPSENMDNLVCWCCCNYD